MEGNLTPGVESDKELNVVNDSSAEVLRVGSSLDLVHHRESDAFEAPPSFRGD
jgi:hypothetical protein